MFKRKKRVLAGALALVLALSSGSVPALAEDSRGLGYENGLCEHHPQHTEECGYFAASGEGICGYECDICGEKGTGEAAKETEGDMSAGEPSGSTEGTAGGEEALSPGEGAQTGTGMNAADGTETGGDVTGEGGDKEPSGTDQEEWPSEGQGEGSGAALTEKAEETESPTELVSWEWVDEEGILVRTEDGWSLSMPGAAESNPVKREDLLSVLPGQIKGQTADGESVTVDLTWDLSGIPEEGIWEGETEVSAAADETYKIAGEGSPLRIKIELGGATENATGENLGNAKVEGVSPKGTTINLFDYWVDETQDSPDYTQTHSDKKSGINQKKDGTSEILRFVCNTANKGSLHIEDVNYWTGTEAVRQGIVSPTLSDGYPTLSDALDEANTSLDYLFSPTVEHDGKASYPGAEGLLQVDEEGYYYYDSMKNFAEYDEKTGKFTLYQGEEYTDPNKGTTTTGAVKAGGGSPNGQFFPFDKAAEVYEDSGESVILNENINSKSSDVNHYFGLTMTTRFVQQDGGMTKDGKEVTYEFSGDDDVWIFIDDVLVADLGGIHDRASLKIDFSTGEIVINEDGAHDYSKKESNLKKQFENAGKGEDVSWAEGKDTFADNTYHTLKFFYLERGNVDSNMSLKFNLVTIPESGIIKVDQAGNKIAGAEFELYEADENYEISDGDSLLCSGVTDEKGELVFVDNTPDRMPVSLDELYKQQNVKYMVLRETVVPEGYRSSGDMKLRFATSANGEVFLLSENHWETGAYASPSVTMQADSEITVKKGNETEEVSLETGGGRMFAVVLQRQDKSQSVEEEENWKAVYGNPEDGWHVVDEDNIMDGVIEAAKNSPYVFDVDSSGAYKTDIENLPGDITKYYYVLGQEEKDNAEYTVGYFYTEAGSLSGATSENTYRVLSDGEEENARFTRVFSVNLYVPNIQNNLYVQKLDENGEPVKVGEDGSGAAKFTLYPQDAVEIDEDGKYTVTETEGMWSQTVTTARMTYPFTLEGAAMFTKIPKGAYYLIETKAPEGYEASTDIIPVIVDNTGVYADAGESGDDVTVQRGVGSIVHSMIQFAADDDVDATLHDVKAVLETGTSNGGSSLPESWVKQEGELHVRFQDGSKILNYFKEDRSRGYFTIDEGWSRLSIFQCLDEGHTDGTKSPKQNLEDTNLANLFSGTVVVQLRDKSAGSLTVSKTVVNETGLELPEGSGEGFTFTLEATENADRLKREYNTLRTSKNTDGTSVTTTGYIEFSGGKAEVTLKDGESIKISGLPTGVVFKVIETSISGYETTYIIGTGDPKNGTEADGLEITEKSPDVSVAFTNTYKVNGELTFTKVDGSGEDASPLSGAVFAVYYLDCKDPDEHTHEDELIEVEDPDTGRLPDSVTCWKLVETATSNVNGTVTIQDIPVRKDTEYRLVELKAPGGYALPEGQWKLRYNQDTERFEPITKEIGDDENAASVGNLPAIKKVKRSGGGETYQIPNYKPGELPFSGNTGIRMFLLLGGGLMLLGAAGGSGWYLYHRRSRAAVRRRRRR